jgi:hypothetical protein
LRKFRQCYIEIAFGSAGDGVRCGATALREKEAVTTEELMQAEKRADRAAAVPSTLAELTVDSNATVAEKEAMSSAKLVQAENRADQAAERETVAKVTVASDTVAEE